MKKCFLTLLAILMMTVLIGCDELDAEFPDGLMTDTPADTEETVAESESPAETETPTETEAPETEAPAETEAPETEAPETEPTTVELSDEATLALLQTLVAQMGAEADQPMTVTVDGNLAVTAAIKGFTTTATMPVQSFIGRDAEGDVALSYVIPMMGNAAYTLVGRSFYVYDAKTGYAFVCELTDEELEALPDAFLAQLGGQLDGMAAEKWPLILAAALPSGWADRIPASWLAFLPEEWTAILPPELVPDGSHTPVTDLDPAVMMQALLNRITPDEIFRSVKATLNTATGETVLTLSGVSDTLLGELDKDIDTMLASVTDAESLAQLQKLKAFNAVLRAQAEQAVSLTLTLDAEGSLASVDIAGALDLSALAAMSEETMPSALALSMTVLFDRDDVAVDAPANAEAYAPITLNQFITLLRQQTPAA